jgi:hypothetical protein
MKKYYSILILISIVNFSFSQVQKKVFYNENLEEISESKFYKQLNF